mmetsp:Transcript_90735/g.270825  ORF Transcript_90735/g.270825 Transcript_90735/m.270825 type:complete len:154 (-) Transcript_90735:280-741(-)
MGGNICCDPSAKRDPAGADSPTGPEREAYISAGHLATDEGSHSAIPRGAEMLDAPGTDTGTGILTDVSQLAGKWCRQVDGLMMGDIVDGEVLWNPEYQHSPSKLSIVTGKAGAMKAADVEMELGSEKHWARYDAGPPQQLIWNDGEVWVPMAA